jgi:histone H3/H4
MARTWVRLPDIAFFGIFSMEHIAITTPDKVKDLVAKVCRDDIDDDAAEILAAMADDVLISIVSSATNVAKSRGSNEVTIDDMRTACEQDWGVPFDEVLLKMPNSKND